MTSSIRFKVVFLIAAYAWQDPAAVAQSYTVDTIAVGGTTERRCFHDSFHFLTIIDDGQGTFALRPHPGVDPNGWGSTGYLQPFFAGAVLRLTVYDTFVAAPKHIQIEVHGAVSRGANDSYGTWTAQLEFRYDPSVKQITGNGTYAIALPGLLIDVGDLNLLKIASNGLFDVPLRNNACGITGDIIDVQVDGDILDMIWTPTVDCPNPPICGDFPSEENTTLCVNVQGRLNTVDTVAQGYPFCIAPAYKPNLSIRLTTANPVIRFGAIFNVSQKRDFGADNVGVTPWVFRESTLTDFIFDVEFESTPLSGDGNDQDFDGLLDGVDPVMDCDACRGNLTPDAFVDGRDVQAFADCLLAEAPVTGICACADMDANLSVDTGDIAEFVRRLLGMAIPCP